MNISLPALLVICGALIAIVLILFWHPSGLGQKLTYPLIVTSPVMFSALMTGTGMGASVITIPMILLCLSLNAMASAGP